jgi:hypothetical protein
MNLERMMNKKKKWLICKGSYKSVQCKSAHCKSEHRLVIWDDKVLH